MENITQGQWFGTSGGDLGETISNSLRFDTSGYLTRTQSSSGDGLVANDRTFTFSTWFKHGDMGETNIFGIHSASQENWLLTWANFSNPSFAGRDSGGWGQYSSTAVFRDPGAWYHLFLTCSSGVLSLRVNNVLQDQTDTQNHSMDKTFVIGAEHTNGGSPMDCYLADTYFIQGTVMNAVNDGFIRLNEDGIYVPDTPTISDYGTNGWHLTYDPTAANGIGHDSSGNGNHFTATGFDLYSNDVKVFFPVTGTASTAALGTTLRGTTPNGNGGTGISVSSTNHMDVDFGRSATSHTLTMTNSGSGVTIYVSPDGTANSWVASNVTNGSFTSGQTITASNNSSFRYLRFTCAGYNVNNVTAPVGGQSSDISIKDTPTNNYAVLSPLDSGHGTATMHDANLALLSGSSGSWRGTALSTAVIESGKYYFEAKDNGEMFIGWAPYDYHTGMANWTDKHIGVANGNGSQGYYTPNGKWYNEGSQNVYGNLTGASGDILQCAYDQDSGTVWVGRNGTWLDSATTSEIEAGTTTNSMFTNRFQTDDQQVKVGLSVVSTSNQGIINFGQHEFKYTAPTGFSDLATNNFPKPTIKNGKEHMNTLIWTGDGTNGRDITGLDFQPDMVWIKRRNGTNQHNLYDSIRGVTKHLTPDNNYAMTTTANSLTAFNSNGIEVGTGASDNTSGSTYAGWCWKAGGAPTTDNTEAAGAAQTAGSVKADGNNASFTGGTIAVKRMSVNTKAGFSMIQYTGTGANGTIPHGLGRAPKFVMYKQYNSANDWVCTVVAPGSATNMYMHLNASNAQTNQTASYTNGVHTDSLLSIGSGAVNVTNGDMIIYCWANVPGYQRIGSYEGNSANDGPHITTGFAPQFVLLKNIDSSNSWQLYDNVRKPQNPNNATITADSTAAEVTSGNAVDFLSNGFKVRDNGSINNAAGTFMYLAIGEHPWGGEDTPPATAR